ncbi:MAG: hypothetical protein AAB511_03925 [Patescibacteria group bacterium]
MKKLEPQFITAGASLQPINEVLGANLGMPAKNNYSCVAPEKKW